MDYLSPQYDGSHLQGRPQYDGSHLQGRQSTQGHRVILNLELIYLAKNSRVAGYNPLPRGRNQEEELKEIINKFDIS